ncbi:CGP-CTERM sorting domain-containing protein [Thermococcus prieurii]
MRKVIALMWIALLIGALAVTPGKVKAEDTNWWVKYLEAGDTCINALTIAPNGDIIVAGETDSFGAGATDAWVLRLDANGNVIWQKTYGGSSWDYANAVAITENGDIIVAGKTDSFGAGEGDVWVLRLDANGNVIWQKTYGGKYGGKYDDWAKAVAIAPNGDIIVAGTRLLRLSPRGELKWAVKLEGSDIKILPDGTAVLVGLVGGFIARFNIDKVPQYSGWVRWDEVSLEVHDTNAQVQSTDAKVKDSNAEIQDTNAEVQDTSAEVKTLWTYTPPKTSSSSSSTPVQTPTQTSSTSSTITQTETSTGYMIGSETIPGFQPSQEYLKNVSAYAIQKAEELITNLTSMGYQVLYAEKYLNEAKNAYNNGDYKTAKELALKAWITALKEWQIQYEAEILKKAGIDPSQALQEYQNGDLDGAINELNSLASDLNGEYAKLFNSVKSTFDTIQFYWKSGIRLWNYVGDLYSSNEKFKDGELEVAKNLADKALNTVRDIGNMARSLLKQLVSLGRSVFSNGRNPKAQELFEHAMSLFEQGKFEQAKKVIVQVEEIITVTTTQKKHGICGPGIIVLIALVPLLRRLKHR